MSWTLRLAAAAKPVRPCSAAETVAHWPRTRAPCFATIRHDINGRWSRSWCSDLRRSVRPPSRASSSNSLRLATRVPRRRVPRRMGCRRGWRLLELRAAGRLSLPCAMRASGEAAWLPCSTARCSGSIHWYSPLRWTSSTGEAPSRRHLNDHCSAPPPTRPCEMVMSPIRPRLSQWVRSDEKAEHVQQQSPQVWAASECEATGRGGSHWRAW